MLARPLVEFWVICVIIGFGLRYRQHKFNAAHGALSEDPHKDSTRFARADITGSLPPNSTEPRISQRKTSVASGEEILSSLAARRNCVTRKIKGEFGYDLIESFYLV